MPKQTEELAIQVKHLSKSFRLPHNRQNSIKGSLINLLGRGDRTYETQEVLKDVSFDIKKGEFFGIVGRNGSGKSTLLKMIAGIYEPTEGSITINGSLTPFIELGVGFNPELTGRENVYMNGALLGFSNKEVDEMYDDIAEFAELERFMDQKLKNYSSGMQVRLAFSIAIRAQSDILVLDEVLAVGDEAFQQKCYQYFYDLKEQKKTVVLVTHDMGAVERYCTKAIMIEKGKIVCQGSSMEVASAYRRLFLDEEVEKRVKEGIIESSDATVNDVKVRVTSKNKPVQRLKIGAPLEITITYNSAMKSTPGSIAMSVVNAEGVTVISTGEGMIYDDDYIIKEGLNSITFRINDNQLSTGRYAINIGIAVGERLGGQKLVYQQSGVAWFSMDITDQRTNAVLLPKVEKIVN